MREIHIERPRGTWCASCKHVAKTIKDGEEWLARKDFIIATIDIACKDYNIREDQMEISSEIEYEGKGYGRFLPRSEIVNCPRLKFEREN